MMIVKTSSPTLDEISARARLAYSALPRGANGAFPSQRALAQQHGFQHDQFSKLLSGKYLPNTPTLLKMCEAMCVTMDWLLTGKGKDPEPVDGRIWQSSSRGSSGKQLRYVEETEDAIFEMRASGFNLPDELVEKIRLQAAASSKRPKSYWKNEILRALEHAERRE